MVRARSGTAGEDDAARSMRRRSPPGLKGEARPGRPLASLAASEGLPAIRLHDMRHSYTTAGLAAGVPPKVMSERLGTPPWRSRSTPTRARCRRWTSPRLMSSPPSSSAQRRLGVLVPPYDEWTLLQCRVDEEPMVHSDDATGGSLQVVSPAPPIARRRVPTLAALAKPAGQLAGFLLVEVLSSPRGRPVALGLARSLWTPSGRRAFLCLSPCPGVHDCLASHGCRGVRRRRRPGPSSGDACARLEAFAGGSGDGSCLGLITRPSSGTGAGRSVRCCSR
jgi:hypothetical protein